MKLMSRAPRSISVNPLSVIDRIIADLELTPELYESATTSYEAVAKTLARIIPDLKLSIFSQGSMRLGTTILPLIGERFDLDMVCWLGISGRQYAPDQVFNLVWNALGQDETYRKMRQRKSRCIRLKYHPDCKYYLDVVPAVPDWAKTESLYVPDHELKIWCPSHPIGYCDGWFKNASSVMPIIRPSMNRTFATVMANDATAEIEPMPEFGQFEKTPLQRIVQMVKRTRDEYFQQDAAHRPSSILLTTIITKAYTECVSQPVDDLLEFVLKVVERMPRHIIINGTAPTQNYHVVNPVNDRENFAENWTAEHYRRFMIWHSSLEMALKRLQQSKGLGTDVLLNRLSDTFGQDKVVRAAKALGADTNALHDAGKLRISNGAIGAAGSIIPATVNFGRG